MIRWFLSHLTPRIPGRLHIGYVGYSLDGGTIILGGHDESEQYREVMLVQHMFPMGFFSEKLGRLYVDNRLVRLRSGAEVKLLVTLEVALQELRDNVAQIDFLLAIPAFIRSTRLRAMLYDSGLENLDDLQDYGRVKIPTIASVIEYVRSDDYGKVEPVPQEYEEDEDE